MTNEEALGIVEQLLYPNCLSKIEKIVFNHSWEGQSYRAIAKQYDYNEGFIRNTGSRLWRLIAEAIGEKVTKSNLQLVIRGYQQREKPICNTLCTIRAITHQDWGEAMASSVFYGRDLELATLKSAILQDCCRLVALSGKGKIGKTALLVKLAMEIQNEFKYVIWRKLGNTSSLGKQLGMIIQFLSHHQEIETSLSQSVSDRITCLIKYLRVHRCLLILDRCDDVLHSDGYSELLTRVGETQHQSCVLVTVRKQPLEMMAMEKAGLPVFDMLLTGLKEAEGQRLLQDKGLSGSADEMRKLVEHYQGNPLALQIAATSLRDLSDGNLSGFFNQKMMSNDKLLPVYAFDGIRTLLDWQIKCLSNLEL
jgi:NB-ARC domain